MVGLSCAKFLIDIATSNIPRLVKRASHRVGRRHSTNTSISFSVSLADEGTVGSQEGLECLSLKTQRILI